MSDNVIKFGKAAKAVKRARKDAKAAENRARFGQKKAHKDLKAKLTEKLQSKLDAHKIEKNKDETPKGNTPENET
ncbi:uncharacterized protein DUF4169 [Litorimonas taeanensis]|uniref:Uncharacterized protein DUF4169 n=1 Tax=Litorimonas taeanensis TaxID=568099 RepID=A0A420WKZ1_9PROT|nr:DUF4169 family protein [Litorimonas taeanensis]RKQ71688.1 uncharacterized protein DUF4169 [Litorimonas taeanensis]